MAFSKMQQEQLAVSSERRAASEEWWTGRRLAGWAAIAVTMLSALTPMAGAQQIETGSATAGLPPQPTPNPTLPVFMRPGVRDFSKTPSPLPNPIAVYRSPTLEPPSLYNSPRLTDLLRDGKIYLSLNDAIMLTLENNFDIAIARFNLDISDTDIVRARAGNGLAGSPAGLVTAR
jgi:outer membrane protein